jgi:polo-like kinase 4
MLNTRKAVHLAESTALHARLRHPNIVQLLSAFEDGPASYHVLEHCGGGTLADMIRSSRHGRLGEAQVKSVVEDLVHALLYLRKERVVHRDIKAGNVLVMDDGSVVGSFV